MAAHDNNYICICKNNSVCILTVTIDKSQQSLKVVKVKPWNSTGNVENALDTVFHSVPPWCWVVAIFHRHFIIQPVTSRGNATLTTYNTLHNQSEKSSRFPPEEAWGDRERSRKWSRDGGRVAGRPGRVAVGPLQRLASTTSLCSASSRRHVAQRKISSSLQTEAEGTQPTNMLLFFILRAKKNASGVDFEIEFEFEKRQRWDCS